MFLRTVSPGPTFARLLRVAARRRRVEPVLARATVLTAHILSTVKRDFLELPHVLAVRDGSVIGATRSAGGPALAGRALAV